MKATARILVADDSNDMTETLRDILCFMGYEVVKVADGAEAIERIQQQPFDLVLLDAQMPQVDGIAAFYEIQQLRPEIPVMLMSAWEECRELEEARHAGVIEVFTKPFDPHQLIAQIQKVVEGSQTLGAILVVDDDPRQCEALKRSLLRHGYQVDVAYLGREAIEKVRERPYGIVFLDIRLPDIHGVEVYTHIKQIHPQIVGILMTGYAQEPEVKRLLQVARRNGYACLEKPFPIEDAVSLIGQLRHGYEE